MNPLVNNIRVNNGGNNRLPPHLQQNIQQVKSLMQFMKTNPMELIQQNPMINQMTQIAQMYKGQNLEQVFKSMCQSQGIDPNVIINQLR